MHLETLLNKKSGFTKLEISNNIFIISVAEKRLVSTKVHFQLKVLQHFHMRNRKSNVCIDFLIQKLSHAQSVENAYILGSKTRKRNCGEGGGRRRNILEENTVLVSIQVLYYWVVKMMILCNNFNIFDIRVRKEDCFPHYIKNYFLLLNKETNT